MKTKNIFSFPALLFFFCPLLVNAQDTARLNQFRSELLSAKDDTSRVNELRHIGREFSISLPDSAIYYTHLALDLAEKISWTKGIASACLNLGGYYTAISQFDSGIFYCNKALTAAEKVGNKDRIALIYFNRGSNYIHEYQYTEAMKDFLQAEQLAIQTGNKDRLGRVQLSFGFLYLSQENYKAAIPYYQKALEIFTELKDTEQIANAEGTMASIYVSMKKYSQAEPLLLHAIQLELAINDYLRLPGNYYDLGTVYLEQNRFHDAINTILHALEIAQQNKDQLETANAYSRLGEAYLQNESYDEAIKALLKGLQADTANVLLEQNSGNHLDLSVAYNALSDYKSAYDHLNKAYALNDTISSKKRKKDLLSLQIQYETEKKEKENQLLKAENIATAAQLQRNRAWLIAAGIAILLLVVLYRSYQLRQRARLQIVRDKISRDLHDDIGASLSSIRMYSEAVQGQAKDKFSETKSILKKISDNSKEIVENMSDIVWAINPKNDSLQDMEDRMSSFAIEICASKNISVKFDFDQAGLKLPMDIRKNIFLIYKEAVNNAVKYSGGTTLHVQLKKVNHALHLEVSDNGIGFDPKEIKRGNGLHNMQQRAHEIKAVINIDGASGKGTNILVSVHLPKFGDMGVV